MSKLKKIPSFKNEEEEREFWAAHDSSEYVDWKRAERAVFPNLKPSTKTISLRLPEHILDEIKMLARKRDVPYQSLINVNDILAQQCRSEINRQQNGDLNQIIGNLTDLQHHSENDAAWMLNHLQSCQKSYREMLLNGHLDFPTYLNLYQMQLLLSAVLINAVPQASDLLP